MTLQVTHRIARDIDVERDHIVATLTAADPAVAVDWIRHFASGYHARNGGGDQMVTDGDLPVVDLRRVKAPAAARLRPATDSRDKRPASTTFSAGVALLRGLVGVVLATILFVDPTAVPDLTGSMARSSIVTGTAITLLAVATLDVGLGLATFSGRNWSRVLLMLSCAVTIMVAFVATARGGPRPTLGSDLPHVGLGILMLLALTSAGARQYATRGPRAAR